MALANTIALVLLFFAACGSARAFYCDAAGCTEVYADASSVTDADGRPSGN